MKNHEWSPAELKSKMEAYCAAAEHCETEARMRLRQWKCDSRTEDEIIDYLIAENYISDERYAKAFVHDKLLYQGWGRVKIEYMLRSKHIPSSTIQSALQTINPSDYSRILSRLISHRLKLSGSTIEAGSSTVDVGSGSTMEVSSSTVGVGSGSMVEVMDSAESSVGSFVCPTPFSHPSLFRFLTQRGFTLDEINTALSSLSPNKR